ncbi:Cuticle protein 19 [Amphibalanus amphitrite]|uniref:Cuticle protein 19 n=1 Tax=Amphibalanus amphitrite TaxID=1232801 RepID=A0A6A4X8H3_AMPAM|nr:Cuticle protein 19 [Amphibalanus amphitrite]
MKRIVLLVLLALAAGDRPSANGYQENFNDPSGSNGISNGGDYDILPLSSYEFSSGGEGDYKSAYTGDYFSVPDYVVKYGISDPYSGVSVTSREDRLGDRTEGSYAALLPDGRRQDVTYRVQGASGFVADVRTSSVACDSRTPFAPRPSVPVFALRAALLEFAAASWSSHRDNV